MTDIWMEQFELEQPLISKKDSKSAYSVERNYVNSKSYHDKFEKIPVNKVVQQALYIEAGRLLEFVDGQAEERLSAINARTGEFIVDNFARKGMMMSTGFNEEEMKEIDKCNDGIVLLHNHSLNVSPSIQDMLTYLHEEKVKLSLILCHDGTVYGIYEVKPEFEYIYQEYLNVEKERTNDLNEAKYIAAMRVHRFNEKLGTKQKLFTVKHL